MYDSLNQLVRENDQKANKTTTYTYINGNITERNEYEYTTGALGAVLGTKTWQYGDSIWSDLLTNFNGQQITYDEIGNPITINNISLSWEGRQLKQVVDGNNTYDYQYNADGQRISKTVNGLKTEFVYNGSILAGQKCGNDTIIFMYDNNGDTFGFNYNGNDYFYMKNAQNDVTAIADTTGAIVVNYNYDAWGEINSITGSLASTIGELNPIRYRSYYFDSEINKYYLNSRYYSPNLCRFINSDGIYDTNTGILSHNMFTYCNNNPVNRIDFGGTKSWWGSELFNAAKSAFVKAANSVLKWLFNKSKDEDVQAAGEKIENGTNIYNGVNKVVNKTKSVQDNVSKTLRLKSKYAEDVVNAGFANNLGTSVALSSPKSIIFGSDTSYTALCLNTYDTLIAKTSLEINRSIEGLDWGSLDETEQMQIVNTMGAWDTKSAFAMGLFCSGESVYDLTKPY